MARQSRIDVPGALHHIIGGGNKRGKIFEDKSERRDLLDILTFYELRVHNRGILGRLWRLPHLPEVHSPVASRQA